MSKVVISNGLIFEDDQQDWLKVQDYPVSNPTFQSQENVQIFLKSQPQVYIFIKSLKCSL